MVIITILTWMAWGGGIALFFQLVSILFGFDSAETDIDIDMDIDVDTDTDTDSGGGLRLFSILGFTSFLFMFGLAGRYFILTVGLHWSLAILIAFALGVGLMYIIAYLFYKAKSLETNGVTRIQSALDCTGTVYLPINGNRTGAVHVNVNGIMKEYNANVYNYGDSFKVGDSIKVAKVQGRFLRVIKNDN